MKLSRDNRLLLRVLKELGVLYDVVKAVDKGLYVKGFFERLISDQELSPISMCLWSATRNGQKFYSELAGEFETFKRALNANGKALI